MRPTTAFDDNVFDINALLHPGTVFDHPKDVLADPALPEAGKRELLGAAQQTLARRRRRYRSNSCLGGHRGTGPGSINWMPPSLSTVSTRAALASKAPMRS